jgi:LmbE family N-acetylglucosaminyl deacetylase
VVTHGPGGVLPNRIDQDGTTEDRWDSWTELGQLGPAEPAGWASAVIIAAHPDDEVLGVGGTMAMLAAAGTRLRLVAVTDGEASHPGTDPAEIARTRVAESAAALQVLGLQGIEVARLRLPDTRVAEHENELVARLLEQCAGFSICLAPWEADAHADHEAAGRAARQAARELQQDMLSYPIWMWHWAKPADARVPWHQARQVSLSPAIAARKKEAISAFTSQLTERDGTGGPVLPAGVVAHFTRRHEVLLP